MSGALLAALIGALLLVAVASVFLLMWVILEVRGIPSELAEVRHALHDLAARDGRPIVLNRREAPAPTEPTVQEWVAPDGCIESSDGRVFESDGRELTPAEIQARNIENGTLG